MSAYLLIIFSYLLGSIPFGLMIGKIFYHKDVRDYGSGNVGASNVGRVLGKGPGLTSFVLDVLKGFVPVVAARHLFPVHPWLQIVTGLAAILGHNNSIFLKFTGGKGVATSCGVAIALSWKAALVGLAIWGGNTYLSGFISLGSIISAPVTGYLIWEFNNESLPYGLFGLLVGVTVVYKHRGNIKRLIDGTELNIRDKKLKNVKDTTAPLILASASPRRKELLAHVGIAYTVVPSSVDEESLISELGDVGPQELVEKLAMAKAADVSLAHPGAVVIGADTVVVFDGKILGKPADAADAERMLSQLSGRVHEVYTGIAVVSEEKSDSASVQTEVTFRTLKPEEIAAYIASGEPMDKAGAYGIQNDEHSPVESINGDYYNVVGLPLSKTSELLKPYFPCIASAPAQPEQWA